jgi:serine/threonine-protein kinase SRPK3
MPSAFIRRAQIKKQKYINRIKKLQKQEEESLPEINEMEVSEKMLAKVFNNKYITLKYLGSGTFSKVWLVYDVNNDKYYAMKMYYPRYEEDGKHEIKYLTQVGKSQHVVNMIDHFTFKDPEETTYTDKVSVCIIVELMGRTLMKLYDIYDNGVPYDVFQKLSYNALQSLNELHSKGVIHTDIKLENLMLDQLTGDVKAVVEWFKKLNVPQIYSKLLNDNIPDNFGNLTKNKQKKLKQQIKHNSINKLATHLYSIINNHVNEMNQFKVDLNQHKTDTDNNTSNDTLDIDLDEDLPDLVNLEEVKQHEIKQSVNINEFIHDDELDMELSKATVKIADFGNACSINNIDDDDIQIRSYRAPEVVMGEMYNEKVDVWSMACLFYELLTHEYLFEVETEHDDNVEQDRLLLAQMYATLGKMPYDYCIDCERTYQLFDEKGKVKKHKKIEYNLLENRIKSKRPDLTNEQLKNVTQLIQSMMQYELKKRLSAKECMSLPIYCPSTTQVDATNIQNIEPELINDLE